MTIALVTSVDATPPGTCPFCHRPMDESGCRLGSRWTSEDLRASGGIEKVVDVYCASMPSAEPTPEMMGAAIQRLREALRLSVEQFAGACGLSAHRLREIESGEVEATATEHRNILKGLGFAVIG